MSFRFQRAAGLNMYLDALKVGKVWDWWMVRVDWQEREPDLEHAMQFWFVLRKDRRGAFQVEVNEQAL